LTQVLDNWDEDLNLLKQESIDSNKLRKTAGKPPHGLIFDNSYLQKFRVQKKTRAVGATTKTDVKLTDGKSNVTVSFWPGQGDVNQLDVRAQCSVTNVQMRKRDSYWNINSTQETEIKVFNF
jgi:hypothetical protein